MLARFVRLCCYRQFQRQLSVLTNPTVQQFFDKVPTLQCDSHLAPLIQSITSKRAELQQLSQIRDSDKELKELAEDDMKTAETELRILQEEFFYQVMDEELMDGSDSVVVEIAAGVGGQEAMLFAGDLYNMYSNYSNFNGWSSEILHLDTENDGIRHASFMISGNGAYKTLKYEAGVHRVQRVPRTEKSGRIHTSTASVAILPASQNIEMNIKPSDLKIETKRATGSGGMHVNTTDSAVRIVHLPTGIAVDCQQERSQIKNRTLALKMLTAKLYEKELQQQMKQVKDIRKMQVGLVDRSCKIRTFNFVQDRVTDHRIAFSTFGLQGILQGEQDLHKFVSKLLEFDKEDRILHFCKSKQLT